jgi:hypothetical protein
MVPRRNVSGCLFPHVVLPLPESFFWGSNRRGEGSRCMHAGACAVVHGAHERVGFYNRIGAGGTESDSSFRRV